MTAQVISLATRRPVPPVQPVHAAGAEVWIVVHDWTAGENRVRATVLEHEGEWVAVKVKGFGRYAVHEGAIEAIAPAEVA